MFEFIKQLELYLDMIKNTYVSINLVIRFSIVVMMFGAIRFMFLRHEVEAKKKKRYNEYDDSYILEHVAYETMISFMITYIVVILTGARANNLIVNYCFAPGIGAVLGMLIDNTIIIPRETAANAAVPLAPPSSEPVGEQFKNPNEDDSDIYAYIDNKISQSPDFEEIAINAINKISNIQKEQNINISKLNEDNNLINTKLTALYDSNIKIVTNNLQEHLYECLEAGFATPKQDVRINNEYKIYKTLNVHDEHLDELYSVRYSKLGVHEDRRKNRDPNYNGTERRKPKVNNLNEL